MNIANLVGDRCKRSSINGTQCSKEHYAQRGGAVPVGRYNYNGIGEMTSKTLGCNLQKVDYSYQIRGWLSSINNPANLVADKDLFGMTLQYDQIGNITTWNYQNAAPQPPVGGVGVPPLGVRGIVTQSYGYDNLNRLKTASLSGMSKTFTLGGNDNGVNYDEAGNIKNMTRTWNGAMVDNMTYTYGTNSNKLNGINDAGTADPNFFATAAYTYDANGNLKTDSGKGITDITYNYLNLTESINKNGQNIDYVYTANGQKLQTVFGNNKKYDYLAGGVFANDTLEFVPTAEGRFTNAGGYEYFLKDHLGNLRTSCGCNAKGLVVLQENHFDPWGLDLPMGLAGNNRYQFLNRETQPETGYIDLIHRQFDPKNGRFNGVDPLAEIARRFSPYVYGNNNPLRFIDPDGMTSTEEWKKDNGVTDSDLTTVYQSNDEGDGEGDGGDPPSKKKKELTNYTTTIANPDPSKNDQVVQAGLGLATVLALDDATVVGVLDDPLIPVILAGTAIYAAVTTDYAKKMSNEIDRILRKATGPDGSVYELRVRRTGTYLDVRGNPVALNAGDIWKYGETTIGQARYDQKELNNMIPGGVIRNDFYFGNQVQIKIMEKYLIYGYYFNKGTLPPGNRYFR